MALRPEASLGVGLATAGVVVAIYAKANPSIADIRVSQPNDEHIASSERAASWTATAVVGTISLLAKDPTIFILGGAAVIIMAWWTRHANTINPLTNSASMEGAQHVDVTQPQDESDYADVVGF